MAKQFIVIITCYLQEHNEISSGAVLFNSFDEAYSYAEKDANCYKHLASQYTEKIGTNKLHASITLKGKYIHKKYIIRDLDYDKERNVLDKHLNTYTSWDYLPNGVTV